MNKLKLHYSRLLELDLPAEAKYFLAIFLKKFGAKSGINLKAQELSKILGMNTRMVKKCIDMLVDKNFLTQEKATLKNKNGGRPSFTYKYGDKLNGYLEKWEKSDNVNQHEYLIEKILSKNSSKKKGSNKNILKAPTKVLLAALLLHADKRGVVKDLGKADLKKLTGMSKERLKSQIRLLSKTKYLFKYLPGFNNHPLFVMVKSVYLIDIQAITKKENINKIVLECGNIPFITLGSSFAFLQKKDHSKPNIKPRRSLSHIFNIIHKDIDTCLIEMLTLKVNEYALSIVRIKLNTLISNKSRFYKCLQKKILEELYAKNLKANTLTKKDYVILARATFKASLSFAQVIIKNKDWIQFTSPKGVNIIYMEILDRSSIILYTTKAKKQLTPRRVSTKIKPQS